MLRNSGDEDILHKKYHPALPTNYVILTSK